MRLNTKLILTAVVAITLLGGGTWAYNANQSNSTPPTNQTSQTKLVERTRSEISYTAKAGLTSLEQLKNEADNLVLQDSDYGPYVDSIEGHKGGTDGKYWSFYIDGEMSNVGANDYKQKGGETITWKFQKL